MAGYTAIDLINKLIQIEKKGCKMYRDIASSSDISPQIKPLALLMSVQGLLVRENVDKESGS